MAQPSIGSTPISVTRASGSSWRQMGSGRGGGRNCLMISNRPGTASPVKGKLQQHLTPLPEALLLAVPMLLGAACAAIQRDTEQMLVAAGFHMRPTDTSELQDDLRSIQSIPPHRLVSRTK